MTRAVTGDNCADALGLIFAAAARPRGRVRHRLPGVVDPFIQWCERAREDFRLGEEIEEQLGRRKAKLVLNHTYRQWRAKQRKQVSVVTADNLAYGPGIFQAQPAPHACPSSLRPKLYQ